MTRRPGPSPITIPAPAKINLFLKTLGHREQGFHEIDSVVLLLDWGDELRLAPAKRLRLEVSGCAPAGDDNLVMKAARLMKIRFRVAAGAAMCLTKRIPAQAGLGGGSSDAAAALRGLNRLWGLELSDRELSGLGAELGSDIPLFFAGPASRVGGRGELTEPVRARLRAWAVLVCPEERVSTPWAYGALRHPHTRRGAGLGELMVRALETGDWPLVKRARFNEFEAPVFAARPGLRLWRRRLLRAGAEVAGMSGSGSALFGLAAGPEHARSAAERLARFPGAQIVTAGLQTAPGDGERP